MRKLFDDAGAHVLVDGQFGSTGKGVLAHWLAWQAFEQDKDFSLVISNAGPNSGHTFYHNGEKHVLKQLPTFGVAMALMGRPVPILLSAGAVIDPEILATEMDKYADCLGPVFIHPNAATITDEDRDAEHSGTIAAVAGTRSGTGAALARKVLRDPKAVNGSWGTGMYHNRIEKGYDYRDRVFFEVSQGFSLGINSEFYPKTTSRECTVAQALADARYSPKRLAKVYMSARTFPIRVGNVDGHSSGEWYRDQTETTWEALGVEAERTTVTNRIRRVATFSQEQIDDAIRANEPDFLFVNFLNYYKTTEEQRAFMEPLTERLDCGMIWGYGPTHEDVYYDG